MKNFEDQATDQSREFTNQAGSIPFFSQGEAEQEFYETLHKLEKENPRKADELYRLIGNHRGKQDKKKNS